MTALESDSALGRLAGFVAGLAPADVPESVRELSRQLLLDAIGAMFAAVDDPVAAGLRRWTARQGAGEVATVLHPGLGEGDAAFVTASVMHALDYDDMAFGGHGTSSVLPACLAIGERSGLEGSELLAAYAAGMEVFGKIAAFGEPADLPLAGWHATSVHGVLGAAAGAARAAGLDPATTAEALAIACSSGAGVRSALGTMVKGLHAGLAASSGVRAVELAEAGLTGSPAMLEGDGGYLQAYFRGELDADALVASLGHPFRMERNGPAIKAWPFCAGTQRAIATLRDVRAEHEIAPEQIDSVTVHVDPRLLRLLSFDWPRDRYEAKFSLRFSLAAAATDRLLDPALFDHATFADEGFARWRERVVVVADRPGSRQDIELLVTTTSGEAHEATSGVLHGTAEDRMSRAEVAEKYRRNVAGVVDEPAARRLEDAVLGLGTGGGDFWGAWRGALESARTGAAS